MKNLITLMIVLITVYFIYKKVAKRSESKSVSINPESKSVSINPESKPVVMNRKPTQPGALPPGQSMQTMDFNLITTTPAC